MKSDCGQIANGLDGDRPFNTQKFAPKPEAYGAQHCRCQMTTTAQVKELVVSYLSTTLPVNDNDTDDQSIM